MITESSFSKRVINPLLTRTTLLYVIREAIGPFLVGLFFFTFVLVIEVVLRMVELIIYREVPILMTLEFFMYMLPFNVAVAIPMAALLAAIMTYGRLSGDNEILALKSMGLSPWHLYLPIIIFGALMTLGNFYFNDVILPAGNYRYRAMRRHISRRKPSIGIDEYNFQRIGSRSISATEVEGDLLRNITVYDYDFGQGKAIITAKKGEWLSNEANSPVIILRLNDGIIQEFTTDSDESSFTPFEEMSLNYVRDVQDTIAEHKKGLREMSALEIYTNHIRPVHQKNRAQRQKYEQRMLVQDAKRMGNLAAYSPERKAEFIENERAQEQQKIEQKRAQREQFQQRRKERDEKERERRIAARERIRALEGEERKNALRQEQRAQERFRKDRQEDEAEQQKREQEPPPYKQTEMKSSYLVEFHKHFSLPVACLIMVLLGAPLGTFTRRSGRGVGFGVSFVVIVIYYFLLAVGELLGTIKFLPSALIIWFPNIVFAIAAAYFMARTFLDDAGGGFLPQLLDRITRLFKRV